MTSIQLAARPIVKRITDVLAEARERTLLLIAPLNDRDLAVQHDPLMSPVIWDLGHIAHFEELWLTRNLDGPVEFVEMPGLYNPFEHPRGERGALALPALEECRARMTEIRERVLDRLHRVGLDDDDPLRRDGYVYAMVAQHEYQHDETIIQTLQLKTGAPYRAPRRVTLPAPTRPVDARHMVRFPGGRVAIGTNDRARAYDNERPRHFVDLPPFWIDAHPVANGAYLEFMNAGGYSTRAFWSDAGWEWLQEAGVSAPKYWTRDDAGWSTRIMDRVQPVDRAQPVCHVCYHEADAFARWAGKRLPTEQEWEAAAAWDAAAHRPRTYPWGEEPPAPHLANVDQLAFDVARIGAYPRNVSPTGCSGMIGDVWEWTSSDFTGYPGFESFPYREYSEVFFGSEYKVLRGGSWATRAGAIRNTFRNWDYPIRRQIFSGFRCARSDA
ncbi:MAG TPA: ergothioneine biosynthesis protein EgtB [Gemmatimonadaceae bacterium]